MSPHLRQNTLVGIPETLEQHSRDRMAQNCITEKFQPLITALNRRQIRGPMPEGPFKEFPV